MSWGRHLYLNVKTYSSKMHQLKDQHSHLRREDKIQEGGAHQRGGPSTSPSQIDASLRNADNDS